MKILVTGNLGFIADAFFAEVKRQDPKTEIIGFDKQNGQDILDADQVENAVKGVDLVFNFAALSHVDFSWDNPHDYYLVNGIGAVNVMIACQKHNVKLIHISTSEVYGTNPNPGVPMDENTRLAPNYPYSEAKAMADFAAQNRIAIGQEIIVVRPFNQYGAGTFQTVEKYIPKLVRLAMLGKPLTVWGEGNQSRDWVYVEDTVEGFWKIAKAFMEGKAEPGVYNLCTGKATSAFEIAKMVSEECEKVLKRPVPVLKIKGFNRKNEVLEHLGDNTKLYNVIKWQPTTSLKEGIRKSIQFYSSCKPHFPSYATDEFYANLIKEYKEDPERNKKLNKLYDKIRKIEED